jgi:methionyl-tRNA formyltransferase
MKIIFAGTPDFSVPPLRRLVASRHEICAVYTQPDRPAGRGQKLKSSPVKQVALENNISVVQPQTLRLAEAQQELIDFGADLMVVVAYGLILPEEVLNAPKFGCLNIHASLLPRWRGAAPIHRAILSGDKNTGVTIMQMDAGLDTGDMLLKRECEIGLTTTSGELHDQLSELGAEALMAILPDVEAQTLNPIKQDDSASNYAKKIDKSESTIDWHLAAAEIQRMVNGFNPWPVAQTKLADKTVRIWQSEIVDLSPIGSAGQLFARQKSQLCVTTVNGVLSLLQLQMPGKKPVAARDFLNGRQVDDLVFGD